jgi:carboxymethylenebutenolidase
METRTVEVNTPDGPMPVYEVIPDAPKGAVMILQEVFGITDHMQDVTRRAAEAGYHTVAPHLFHRTGAPKLAYDFSLVTSHMEALNDQAILGDLNAVFEYLAKLGWGAPQIGAIGFCFGGRIGFLLATERPLGGVVSFYGGGIVSPRFAHLPPLVDRAADLKAPWLGLFGETDDTIPLEDVDRIRNELGANTSVAHDIEVFEGAGHGFHCDARPDHFEPGAAKQAWQRAIEWLETHLATRPESA